MLKDMVSADLMRLLNEERLARPVPIRTRQGQWRRDPGAEWDWYYYLDASLRTWMARTIMSPTGATPDDLASVVPGYATVDDWAAALVQACQLARSRALRDADPLADDYAADDVDSYELLGPDEVAALLQVARNTLAQWRHRGILPGPDLTLSGMPVWERHTVTEWAALTGREIVAASR